uniref:VWFD domain-containing protein n=1 Tax=Arion vulgaris TaxID=1028688 RepID=A0A0B6Z6Y7_9EUPU
MSSLHLLVVVLATVSITSSQFFFKPNTPAPPSVPAVQSSTPYCVDRNCGIDATCNPKTNKCECGWDKPYGHPLFRCYGDTTVSCNTICDPELNTFNDNEININADCTYKLTVIDNPIKFDIGCNTLRGHQTFKANPKLNRVETTVVATNGRSPAGSYFLDRLAVTVSIKLGGVEFTKGTITLSSNGATYSFPLLLATITVNIDIHDRSGCKNKTFGDTNIEFSLCYNPHDDYWTFTIIDTIVTFRSWNISRENQPRRPGCSIATDIERVSFPEPVSLFPNSFCDSPKNDLPDLFHTKCKEFNIAQNTCAFYSILKFGTVDQSTQCRTSVTAFKRLPDNVQVDGFKYCAPIVTALSNCAVNNGHNQHQLFADCTVDYAHNRIIGHATLNKLQDSTRQCNAAALKKVFGVSS